MRNCTSFGPPLSDAAQVTRGPMATGQRGCMAEHVGLSEDSAGPKAAEISFSGVTICDIHHIS